MKEKKSFAFRYPGGFKMGKQEASCVLWQNAIE
jgi:hypothetical protein